jgi:hypothetical protein
MKTLKASLLASVFGTVAWLLGLTKRIWPAHPQWAVFFVTLAATVAFLYILREPADSQDR